MQCTQRHALLALATAGAVWGLSVPLSKLALHAVGPAWLTVIRFALAAPLLAIAGRRHLRAALAPRVLATGALGFGAVILLQNAGIERTSVSHAAVIVGTVPVLVALLAAASSHTSTTRQAWLGYLVALLGVTLVAHGGGHHTSTSGDLLVLGSAALSAVFVALQPRVLARRDPTAVTAVQFVAGALVSLPVALLTQGPPPAVGHAAAFLPVLALALPGTLLPFWLFAYGQARVGAELAGAFVNLEPLVGALAGWLVFGDPAAPSQLAGAGAILIGIVLSSGLRVRRIARPSLSWRPAWGR